MLMIKHLHVTFVLLSISGFVVRALWRLRRGERLSGRWVRTLPHVNDTLLLASGLYMAWVFGWAPWQVPWLGAKLSALIVYIVLGGIALRKGSPAAALAAVATFGYMVAVALTKDPLPWA